MRLEDLVAKKTGLATWRQLFKFLALPEKVTDLHRTLTLSLALTPNPSPNPNANPYPKP